MARGLVPCSRCMLQVASTMSSSVFVACGVVSPSPGTAETCLVIYIGFLRQIAKVGHMFLFGGEIVVLN